MLNRMAFLKQTTVHRGQNYNYQAHCISKFSDNLGAITFIEGSDWDQW